VADQAGWQRAVEAELRELGRELDVPPAGSPTAAVRQRLQGPAARRLHPARRGTGILRRWRPAWRAALIVVELQQEPGPAPSPRSGAALPGERRMSLAEARRHVSFPILVPTALGRPSEVVVSDGGRVASLIYRRTPHGLVRMDEFAGHLDPVFFQKFIHLGDVTQVRVNGLKGLWIKGPHVLLYVTRDGTPAAASARLTTGNTLIWGTPRVALRLEGNLSRTAALAIADSAR